MTTENLVSLLNSCDTSIVKRQSVSKAIIENPQGMLPLMSLAFSDNKIIASKACWIVEFVAKQDLRMLLEHIDYFCENIHKLRDDSSVRPMAKICEILVLSFFKSKDSFTREVLTEEHFEHITTACFDWLIGNYKVASKAYSMTSLFYLGKKTDWIWPELRLVIEQDYAKGSAAYQARGRQVLGWIKKQK